MSFDASQDKIARGIKRENVALSFDIQDKTRASKVGIISKAQKAFGICSGRFLNEKVSVSKHRRGAFHARKTLQKFGYSVLKQKRALFSILHLLLSKTQITSDITSNVRILRQNLGKYFKKLLVGIY